MKIYTCFHLIAKSNFDASYAEWQVMGSFQISQTNMRVGNEIIQCKLKRSLITKRKEKVGAYMMGYSF